MENLIHITFDKAGAENLKQGFALDDIISGEVMVFEDDLAFGPLKNGIAAEGEETRQIWWNKITRVETYTKIQQDHELLKDLCEQMRTDENSEIWIWAAQNTRDVCGYYSLLQPLSDFLGRVHLIYLNNLPFINEKGGIFYPLHLEEILPKEFLKARKLAREITTAEVEVDGEEWIKLMDENTQIRILEGGKKIRSESEDYFDKEIINRCRLDYMKGWRLINQIHQKNKDHTKEDFLYGRLGWLIEKEVLEVKDNYKELRDCEVKVKSAGQADESVINENDEQTN